MDRMAMDALNRGWALGVGTRIRAVDEDFEAALARSEKLEQPPERPGRVGLLFALLGAMGPMPRAAH